MKNLMRQVVWENLAMVALAVIILAAAFLLSPADAQETKGLFDRRVVVGKNATAPPARAAVGGDEVKVTEVDSLVCKSITIKAKEGSARIHISQSGDKGVGIWVSNGDDLICIVAGLPGDGLPYLGTHDKKSVKDSSGCPIAIMADGTIQLAKDRKVKHISLDTLMRLAK